MVQTGFVQGAETIRQAMEYVDLPGFEWRTHQKDVQRIEYINAPEVPAKWKEWDEVADVAVASPFTWIAIENMLRMAGVQKVEFLSGGHVKITHDTGLYSAGEGLDNALENYQHVTRNLPKKEVP